MKKTPHISATQKLLFEMLTENTGIAMMDSGGENGRMWQRNQKKTVEDFLNEPYATFEEVGGNEVDGWDISPTISVFHNLSEQLELDAICNTFNSKKGDWIDSIYMYGINNHQDKMITKFLKEGANWDGEAWNTYNYNSPLSQILQGRTLEWGNEKYVILQIHGGADVRGGYTNARMFKLRGEWLQENVYTLYKGETFSNDYGSILEMTDNEGDKPKGDIKEILAEFTATAECPNY